MSGTGLVAHDLGPFSPSEMIAACVAHLGGPREGPARAGEPAAPGRRVLGRLLLGKTEWRLEAMGGARLQRFRERFETRMGSRVLFLRERLDDLGGRMAAKDPAPDSALVVPEDFVRLLDDCRQPNLLKTVFGDFMAMADDLPKAARITPEATVTSAIVLRYLIDALDEAVGRE